MNKKFALSYSGGKDCALALYRMIAAGYKPAALITTFHQDKNRTWFHGISRELLERAAKSMGIPLRYVLCGPGENYNRIFENILLELKEEGVGLIVFGDIDLQAHRDWCEERCAAAGLSALLPLWKEELEAVVREFLEAGFSAIIKTVRLQSLGSEFLGVTLSLPVLAQIKEAGADVCGENGEYHTFVYDGPIFQSRIRFTQHGIERTPAYAFLNME